MEEFRRHSSAKCSRMIARSNSSERRGRELQATYVAACNYGARPLLLLLNAISGSAQAALHPGHAKKHLVVIYEVRRRLGEHLLDFLQQRHCFRRRGSLREVEEETMSMSQTKRVPLPDVTNAERRSCRRPAFPTVATWKGCLDNRLTAPAPPTTV